MDGTFNQTGRLDRLVGNRTVFSVDFKSATDRWPYLFQHALLDACFGLTFATGLSHLLSGHPFYVPWVRTPDSLVSFCTGQPLGYLSSWPLFVLSHHVYIWACAEKVYPSAYFDRYAILGDDVVIACGSDLSGRTPSFWYTSVCSEDIGFKQWILWVCETVLYLSRESESFSCFRLRLT